MKFVHPEILWALSALAIPVIVHLFNFRRFKKILFPNVAFLREIKQETQSKSKLKHLLILLSRLLALACIVFAFAQPYFPKNDKTASAGEKFVSIYLDNSFSTATDEGSGRILDQLKNKAYEITNSYSSTDRFQLVTNDFEGRHQRFVSQDEMDELIGEVEISPVSRKLSEVFSRQRDILKRSDNRNRNAYLLTDLQSTTCDLADFSNDSTIDVRIVPQPFTGSSNLYIDSTWFASPVRQLNQEETLFLHLVNSGTTDKENIPVELMVNGSQKAVASFNCAAGQSADISLHYTNTEAGFHSCTVHVDDYPVVFDDDFYFSYNVSEKIKITEIRSGTGTRDPVATLFTDDPGFDFQTIDEGRIDYSVLATRNFVVLNELNEFPSGLVAELTRFVSEGGSVLVIPSTESNTTSYNMLLPALGLGTMQAMAKSESKAGTDDQPGDVAPGMKVNLVRFDHFIYRNAFEKVPGNPDLPVTHSWYPLTLASRSESEIMMQLQNGDPFLVSSAIGSGHSYFSAVPLDNASSNFPGHAFFPASLLRMAEFSQPVSPLYYVAGSGNPVVLRNLDLSGEQSFRLHNLATREEFIPGHRVSSGITEIQVHDQLRTAGNYNLLWGTDTVAICSFDYDPAESRMESLNPENIQTIITDNHWTNMSLLGTGTETLASQVSELDKGHVLWWTMIIWSLLFLGCEIILIKFWR